MVNVTTRRLLWIVPLLLMLVIGTVVIRLAVTAQEGAAQAEETPVPAPLPPDNLLVWTEDAAAPAAVSPGIAGQIALIDADGRLALLFETPPQASRIMPCGEAAASPDGTLFAFYVGGDTGDLHLMRGSTALAPIDTVAAFTCIGGGSLRYTPDASRVVYIDFEPVAATREFAAGTLKVVNVANGGREYGYDGVVAFDLTAEGVPVFIAFFTDASGAATEAVIFRQDGAAEREIATLRADRTCRYTSASLGAAPDGTLLALLGHRCTTGDARTSWQLYRIDAAQESATLADTDFAAGTFAPFARTNTLRFTPSGAAALFTLPDGFTASTAALWYAPMPQTSADALIPQQIVMPNQSGQANATPALSPDGNWLAFVITSPNNRNALAALDLRNPTLPPVMVAAPNSGDSIPSFAFSGDSRRLFFTAGPARAALDASGVLMMVDLTAEGSSTRIRRALYAPGLVAARDGSAVYALEYQFPEDTRQPIYLDLVRIEADTGAVTTLYAGATVTNGVVSDLRFAYPLALRPG